MIQNFLTVNLNVIEESVFPKEDAMFAGYQLDDGHGDYNRSYEQNWDIDYADYSTDHRENNYKNYEWKVPKSKKERIKSILNHYE